MVLPSEFTYRKSSLTESTLLFDGVNDFVDLGNLATLWSKSLTKFSFAFWIYPTTVDGTDRDIVKHGGIVAQSFRTYCNNAAGYDQITFQIRDSVNSPVEASNTLSINRLQKNYWNFIVCVYDNSLVDHNLKIYVNGINDAGNDGDLTEAINLSAILTLADSTTDYAGQMKNFKFWDNTALTQQQVLDLMNGKRSLVTAPSYWIPLNEGVGNPLDLIDRDNIGTLSGAVWTTNNGATSIGGDIDLGGSGLIDKTGENNIFSTAPSIEVKSGSTKYKLIYLRYTGDESPVKGCSFTQFLDTPDGHTKVSWAFDLTIPTQYKTNPRQFFDGIDDVITQADSAALDLTKFTVIAWVRYWATGTEMAIVNKGGFGSDTAGQNDNYSLRVMSGGTIRGGFEEGSGTDHYVTSPLAYNDGKWHLCIVTYDQITIRLYIDGVEVDTAATTTTPETNTQVLAIGRNSRVADRFFLGDIDEVRVYNLDWTAEEITNYWNSGTLAKAANLVYENTFGTTDKSLTGQRLINENEEPFGNPVWQSPTSEVPTVPNIGQFITNQYFPILLKYELIETTIETSIENDRSIFRTYFGLQPTQSDGSPGTYHYAPFNTYTGSSITTVADSAALDLNTFTVACWVRTTKDYTSDLAGYLVVKGDYLTETAGQNINYALLISTDVDPNNVAEVLFENSSGNNFYNVASGFGRVNDGKWHFIVGTWDGTNSKIYVDGNLINTENFAGQTPDTNNIQLAIGGHIGFQTFVGDLDEVRIWNVALTAEEISSLYQTGIVPRTGSMVYENSFGGTGSGGGGGSGQTPSPNNDITMVFNSDWGEENTTEDMAQHAASVDPALVISGGDNHYASSISQFTEIMEDAGIADVLEVAIGNHDDDADIRGYFGYSRNYHAHQVENVFVLFLDSENSPNGSAQVDFAEQQLEAARANVNIDWIFVVFHRPIYTAESNHDPDESNMRTTWMPIFEHYEVDLILTGHNHNIQRTYAIKNQSNNNPQITQGNQGPYNNWPGIIHVVNGTGGHDEGSALYNLDNNPAFNAYQNDNNNANLVIQTSNNGKTLTCRFIEPDGTVLHSWVMNRN